LFEIGDVRQLFLSKHRELFLPGDAKDKFDWNPHLTLFKKRFEAKGKSRKGKNSNATETAEDVDGDEIALDKPNGQSADIEEVEMIVEASSSNETAPSIRTEAVHKQETTAEGQFRGRGKQGRGGGRGGDRGQVRGRGQGRGQGRGNDSAPSISSSSSSSSSSSVASSSSNPESRRPQSNLVAQLAQFAGATLVCTFVRPFDQLIIL
jgi:hypothetical protein